MNNLKIFVKFMPVIVMALLMINGVDALETASG